MKDTFRGFRQFILRGNVVDLAVGVIMGAAFNTVVQNLVKDVLTPFIGVVFAVPDFSNWKVMFRGSTFLIGDFLNAIISLLLTALAIYFFIVLPINKLISRMHREPPADPQTKKCPQCLSEISKD